MKRFSTRVLFFCLVLLSVGTVALGRASGDDLPGQSGWKTAGTITVSGKALPNVHFLKKGTHLVFPVLAIAAALGKQAQVDTAAHTVTWGGKSFPASGMLLVDGVAHLSWRELSRMDPTLEYGVSGDRATFSSNSSALVRQGSVMPAGMEKLPFVLVNASNSGMPVDSLDSFIAKGKTTILYFVSPPMEQTTAWDNIVRFMTSRDRRTVARKFDINRPGVRDADFQSPLCTQLGICSCPYFIIYGPDGKLTSDGWNGSASRFLYWCTQVANMGEEELLLKSKAKVEHPRPCN